MADCAGKGPAAACENEDWSSEVLSPSELFAARTRDHKLPARGQKDFLPDGSQRQSEKLRRGLEEHWKLVSEERVERQGSLVKAEWKPKDNVVVLMSPAGKFWQTMGYSEQGKQFLQSEEALYLMECGNVEVFYRELPLSVQEGYELMLSNRTISLQQYQVFSHLKRLGYIVNRFDASAVPSLYERQLNLVQKRDKADRHHRKRKRSRSPSRSKDTPEGQSQTRENTEQKAHEDTMSSREESQNSGSSTCMIPSERAAACSMEVKQGGTSEERSCWWDSPLVPQSEQTQDRQLHSPQRSGLKWDFSRISFPNLGLDCPLTSLQAPDPGLLPSAVPARACDVSAWLQRLNLREERLSRREREQQDRERQYKRGVNEDREVRSCRNWQDYKELLQRRSRQSCRKWPAHLWNEAVKPLTAPGQATSTGDLLQQIGMMQPSRLLDEAAGLVEDSGGMRISFDVYQADTVAEFKKSNPGKPYSRMCVCSFDGPVPDLRTLKRLAFQSGDVPVTYAVVDNGDISFYSFKGFQLPTDCCY
ncbi:tRNA-splicing endonuclease subunit Sen54 isoform X1 [Acipenser ruthenus]|uniref:tRNA-splicing endonuclease subunit Sen54 isoform X1 n=2 Tax=Acipenser ruthenus TaxID=7906 RepID=UPI00274231BC|nr:tRNA-splicing endonuclease subunit Sen54 isoform X1 [Acipenser ruthenus]